MMHQLNQKISYNMEVTIGSNRLGGGKKMRTHINNYERSTHNISTDRVASMAPGVLYPVWTSLATRGCHYRINLDAAARTIPTKGALFGSYKLQVDLFQVPIRLYQALLHNNPLAIGLKTEQVKLPKIEFTSKENSDYDGGVFAKSCLWKYLGLSGMGTGIRPGGVDTVMKRKIECVPWLAYYDIFKCYYANKQEENAYVITNAEINTNYEITSATYSGNAMIIEKNPLNDNTNVIYQGGIAEGEHVQITGKAMHTNPYLSFYYYDNEGSRLGYRKTLTAAANDGVITDLDAGSTSIEFEFDDLSSFGGANGLIIEIGPATPGTMSNLVLTPFPLKNIDDMRYDLLSFHQLGTSYVIGSKTYMPYLTATMTTKNGYTYNRYDHNGLVVKTYLNDIFNNWINTDWIDGENGIAAITAIDVSGGNLRIDALNLQQKLYNMLNRIATSDGTYESYLDVAYEESARRHIETPIFLGGMSSEVVFEEIVQTAPGADSSLGDIGGRGTLRGKKGGMVEVTVDEPSFIMAIASLTPRIYYTQGNQFYLTEIDSIADIHKPALDGIGYQNLIGEQMGWWDTKVNSEGVVLTRHTVGKIPAWLNYMTDVNYAFGDMADVDGKGYMILNRNYEKEVDANGTSYIKDATTYIDPSKFNYAWAYTDLDAQNFWMEFVFNVQRRSLMSAKIIPNV